ncbi:MAG: hypothetical protein KDJ97_25430 [Anaerolineae bacterium]|nr:hypothetical protein [Anaerolineae bacterium]
MQINRVKVLSLRPGYLIHLRLAGWRQQFIELCRLYDLGTVTRYARRPVVARRKGGRGGLGKMQITTSYSEIWERLALDPWSDNHSWSEVHLYLFRALTEKTIESVVVFVLLDKVDDAVIEILATKALNDYPIEIDYVSWFTVIFNGDVPKCHQLFFEWDGKEFFKVRRHPTPKNTVQYYVQKLALTDSFAHHAKELNRLLGY